MTANPYFQPPQTDEYNVLRYGNAVDDLLDRINDGPEVVVYPNGEKTWSEEPEAGTYRLVPWDIGVKT